MARASGLKAGCLAFFVEAELEIVEFMPPYRLVSASQGRVRSRTSWSLASIETAANRTGTNVVFVGDYQLPLALRLVGDRAIETLVSDQVRKSLNNLVRVFASDAPAP